MKPKFDPVSRRQFLVGAGGAALALPLLPSLLPRNAEAQTLAAASSERYFAHMTTWHGVMQDQFYGSLLGLTPGQTQNFAGIDVRNTPLPTAVTGGKVVLSEILQAQSSNLTPRMLSLMNVINGLDFATGVGHNRGGPLGGDAANPTIDQVLGASKTFYPSSPLQPVIVRNPVSLSQTSSGVVQAQETAESNVKLFDRLFKTSTTPTTPNAPAQTVLVDSVKEHAALVKADPRCSADCRTRLDEYLTMLSEVQGKVQQTVNSSFPRPTTDTSAVEAAAGFYGLPDNQVQCEKLWNDIVVAAFAAGISRVYVCGPTSYTFGPEPEHAWHNNYAHNIEADPSKRAGYSAAVQRQFEGAQLDLARKMDAVKTADGNTLLDKGFVASGHELGSGGSPGHHHNRCIPIVTFGNAGGFFKTGQSLDYRDMNAFSWSKNEPIPWRGGLIYNQFMGMVLRSMGLQPSDYSTNNGAFGYPSVRGNNDHTDAMWAAANQNLPWLKA
ncbi:DUF1552 domain-containing protein [Rhizobacter sp. Root1221]|uniref:DUF1552 domain-containing protein n=1 Tax=Rhizobacter sp. Root1221 TaxID=1736433 RepID=UPI0006FB9E0A|nr:DUF1552 domain-containing protein [Rhizobacter sp. Root1221]KQW01555.1 hypothetical protein ASC87_14565 [Rhizobacter sp. Root1221]